MDVLFGEGIMGNLIRGGEYGRVVIREPKTIKPLTRCWNEATRQRANALKVAKPCFVGCLNLRVGYIG